MSTVTEIVRPPEPEPGVEVTFSSTPHGEIVVIRRHGVERNQYVAYAAGQPRTWHHLKFARDTWPEVCHQAGVYPCGIECLRSPCSWAGPIPPGWGELSALQLALFFDGRREGVRTLIERTGEPAPRRPSTEVAQRPVVHVDVAPRRPVPPDFDPELPDLPEPSPPPPAPPAPPAPSPPTHAEPDQKDLFS